MQQIKMLFSLWEKMKSSRINIVIIKWFHTKDGDHNNNTMLTTLGKIKKRISPISLKTHAFWKQCEILLKEKGKSMMQFHAAVGA